MGDQDDNALVLLKADHERLKQDYEALREEFRTFVREQQKTNTTTATQFAVLNLKAGAWGAIMGALVAIGSILIGLT